MTWVIDASVTIRLLAGRATDDALRRRLSSPQELHPPQLLDAAVASGIRGLMLGGKMPAARGDQMREDFAKLRIVRYPMGPHLRRVLALRHSLTAYDAFYVALAEELRLPLLTIDGGIARARGHRADVELYRASP